MRWGCSRFSTWFWVCPISLVCMMATHPAKLFGVLPRCISLRAAPSISPGISECGGSEGRDAVNHRGRCQQGALQGYSTVVTGAQLKSFKSVATGAGNHAASPLTSK